MHFLAPVRSQVPRTCNLKYLKIFHPKKLTHTKFQDERMTRKILITENVNSK